MLSNVNEQSVRNEFRRLWDRVRQLEGQTSEVFEGGNIAVTHSELDELDFASSGHTGFASSSDLTDHTGNTSNPHSVTWEQAITANNTASTTFKHTGEENIFSGSATAGARGWRPAIINDTTSGGGLFFGSNNLSGYAFAFATINTSNPTTHTQWREGANNGASGNVLLELQTSGELNYASDGDDIYIHEKMGTVVPTGNWSPTTGTWDFTNVSPVDLGSMWEVAYNTAGVAGFANGSRARMFLDSDSDTLKYNTSSSQGIPVARVERAATAPIIVQGLWIDTSGSPHILKAWNGVDWGFIAAVGGT